jgi:hypothetical protein
MAQGNWAFWIPAFAGITSVPYSDKTSMEILLDFV